MSTAFRRCQGSVHERGMTGEHMPSNARQSRRPVRNGFWLGPSSGISVHRPRFRRQTTHARGKAMVRMPGGRTLTRLPCPHASLRRRRRPSSRWIRTSRRPTSSCGWKPAPVCPRSCTGSLTTSRLDKGPVWAGCPCPAGTRSRCAMPEAACWMCAGSRCGARGCARLFSKGRSSEGTAKRCCPPEWWQHGTSRWFSYKLAEGLFQSTNSRADQRVESDQASLASSPTRSWAS